MLWHAKVHPPRLPRNVLTGPFVVAGLLVLLIAPTIWALLPLWSGTDTINLVAGLARSVGVLEIIAHTFIPESEHAQPALEHYLLEHEGQARYLVVTMNASTAAPFTLDTGKFAIAPGGYEGFDPTMSVPLCNLQSLNGSKITARLSRAMPLSRARRGQAIL